MPEKAIGLPDPEDYGTLENLRPGSLYPFFVQLHRARRAGIHEDVRLGDAQNKLMSWAARKGLPVPGQRVLAQQQPRHTLEYGPWAGVIPEGYGAGEVESKIRGKALVTAVDENGVSFVTAHQRYPERFRLQRMPQFGDKAWLLINTTPHVPLDYKKVHYRVVSEKDAEKLFTPENIVQAKIDGSAAWLQILGDKIETVSYRTSKQTGRPIVHTERAGLATFRSPQLKAYKDTLLRAEIYGERKGRAIPAAELGGLLNATIERSLQAQKAKNIAVKHMVFDVLRFKGKDVTKLPYEQRLKLVQQVVKALPDSFSVPESYRTPAEMRELWREIKTKKHPLSEEGIIAHPTGTGAPTKVKLYPEADVTIEKIFPGEGALTGTAAGGFEYSLPGKPGVVVGRVGTGFGREDRADMWKNPDAWVGRSVRIKAQEQFPSGAYRAPVFIARHEG